MTNGKTTVIISNVNDLQSIGNYCGEKYKDIYYKVSVENNILDVQNNNFEPICEMYDEAEKDKAFANVGVGWEVSGDNLTNENYTIKDLQKQENYIGFDFYNTWIMSDNYAILKNVNPNMEIKYNNENTLTSNLMVEK